MTTKTLAALTADWQSETRDYRPSAFWFWNADMQPETMKDIIAEMAKNKIREFLIHPIHGLEIEYLSEEYFNRCRLAFTLAKQHGLKVWIYDEFAWPSGTAGGKLLRDHPEHKGWYLAFSRDSRGNIVARPEQSNRVLDNVTGTPWTCSEPGYLDTLSVEAVRCFIEMTHERYYKECRDFFGDVIVGFFTDEPAAMMNSTGNLDNLWQAVGLPWTPSLPSEFKKRFGYEIEPLYEKLAESAPSEVKRDYWSLAKNMHAEAYHGEIGRWCRSHGVKYTGHVGEDWPLQQVRFAGSLYQSLGQMDEPGIDFLGYNVEPDQRFAENVAVTSTARHHGNRRVFCEAFGISPFDLRLGEMFRRAEMMGLYGVNDFALMGFHQSMNGFRKRVYWPPIFRESPWWPFYPEFRDAFARSVGLANGGKRQARYALLYPQNALEETDVFYNDFGKLKDAATRMIAHLGLAVYAAGETFEFVFPEMLAEGKVTEGRIVFPFAEYEAILAPADVSFFEESMKTLSKMKREGGKIYREPIDSLCAKLKNEKPSWSDLAEIQADLEAVRIFRVDYPDGKLFVLRNVSEKPAKINFTSRMKTAAWNPVDGSIAEIPGKIAESIAPHSSRYFTLSEIKFAQLPRPNFNSLGSIHGDWQVETLRPNLMRFSSMQFHHETLGWINADPSAHGNMIPKEFFGQSKIKMRASFDCRSLPDSLGILFEREHLSSLAINGQPIDLTKSQPMMMWDASCVLTDIRKHARPGKNDITAELTFKPFETSLVNDAFFANKPMPGCDVCLAGSFKVIDQAIVADDHGPLLLPIDLGKVGWPFYHGIITILGDIEIDSSLAREIRAIRLELTSEDAVEVDLDGNSLGRRITPPYDFAIPQIAAGHHRITIHLAGTSANILDKPVPWGLRSVEWLK